MERFKIDYVPAVFGGALRTRTTLQASVLRAATCPLSFLLLIAAPVLARAQEERLVPPLPIPHVARTAAHSPAALSPPLPRPRPAPTAPSPASVAPAPIVPDKAVNS